MTAAHRLLRRLSDPAELSRAEAFDLLSNGRRRAVIRHLRTTDAAVVDLEDLIDAVVAWDHGADDAVTEHQRASVYSSLVQTHLPRLAEASVVEFDAEAGTVTPTRLAREVELYLEYSPRADIPWAEFYLGLGALGAALLSVVWAEVPPFDRLSGTLVAAAVVAILLVAAVVHLLETRRGRLTGEQLERELRRE